MLQLGQRSPDRDLWLWVPAGGWGSNATGNLAALAALKSDNNMHLGAQNWQTVKD
jgi:hypothetical protein